jgi:ADP-ribosyl-[dinitrogen reductase] hydrolase
MYDRMRGGLYGVAVGDALGGTTEFMRPADIQSAHGYLTEIVGGGVWRLEPGEVTDDTMMTLCVAEGMLEQPDNPMEAIGSRFLAWYRTRPKDVGNTIRHALEAFEGDWFDAAIRTDRSLGQSGGNGSLMRCLPVALGYARAADIEKVTRMQSRMTHYDVRCDEACVIYNRIAARLLTGEGRTEAVRLEVTGTAYEDVLDGEPPGCEPTGFVVDTMRLALHHFLVSHEFAEVVQRAANGGGDSDTIGAIAGGLAGIYWGYQGIPARYAEAILVRETLDDTASRLWRLRQSTP